MRAGRSGCPGSASDAHAATVAGRKPSPASARTGGAKRYAAPASPPCAVGAGANANVTADLVAFSRSKGLYGGLNLEGSVLHVSDKYNRAYYGTAALPPDILVRATVHNPQADRMVADLNRLASRKKSDDQS